MSNKVADQVSRAFPGLWKVIPLRMACNALILEINRLEEDHARDLNAIKILARENEFLKEQVRSKPCPKPE